MLDVLQQALQDGLHLSLHLWQEHGNLFITVDDLERKGSLPRLEITTRNFDQAVGILKSRLENYLRKKLFIQQIMREVAAESGVISASSEEGVSPEVSAVAEEAGTEDLTDLLPTAALVAPVTPTPVPTLGEQPQPYVSPTATALLERVAKPEKEKKPPKKAKEGEPYVPVRNRRKATPPEEPAPAATTAVVSTELSVEEVLSTESDDGLFGPLTGSSTVAAALPASSLEDDFLDARHLLDDDEIL